MNPRIVIQTLLLFLVCLSPAAAQEGRIAGVALSSGFSMGLPLGIPPGPTNDRMLAVAPEDVAAYLSWSRVARADPQSSNRTEQLIANPEVRYLLDHLATSFRQLITGSTRGDKGAEAIAEIGRKLVETLVTHETAIYLRTVDGPTGGLVCDLGDEANDIKTLVAMIAKMGGDRVTTSTIEGLTVYSVAVDSVASVQLTVGNRYLILAVGDEELASILDRFKGNLTAAWLEQAHKRLAVDRPSSLSYINVDHLARSFGNGRALPAELSAMGLDDIRSMTCVTGFDKDAIVIQTLFQIKEPLQERLQTIGGKLTTSDISSMSPDSTLMAAAKLDPNALMDAVFTVLEEIEEGLSEDVEREFAREFGMQMRRDIVDALGSTIQLYESPREGGRLLTGWTAVIDIRDRAKMLRLNSKLEQTFSDPDAPARIKKRQLGRDTVSYLTFSRRGPGFTPSWSISGNRLIVSAFPQNIYGLLNRSPMPPSKSIVARLQERDSFLFIKIREKDVAQLAYPLVELVAAQLPAEMPNDVAQWIEFDPGALPSLPAITDHLDNATITCNVTDGLEIVRRQTLPPSGASLLAVIGMMSD
ncbi:MAG: hypothetical protein HKN47_06370, partial [Pirellulaceae bacterium]|nr:hypothetical protein [Pirellulaceae bacterium]